MSPHALETAIEELQIIRFISYLLLVINLLPIVATCLLIFYDHILTIPEEITLVWLAPNNFAKFSFLLYRYGTPVSLTFITYSISGHAVGLNDTLSALHLELFNPNDHIQLFRGCLRDNGNDMYDHFTRGNPSIREISYAIQYLYIYRETIDAGGPLGGGRCFR
ncbi:hypothetical protein BU17DRAFT_67750 [Hysterangium stoloniferum]|nr:hypothetical protein BU17DRAFT_67750 [Hysterangium stoloniferum]